MGQRDGYSEGMSIHMPDRQIMLFGTQWINDAGHLEIGGCDAVDLVTEFGTPLYVIDEADLRERCREYRGSFAQRLPQVSICFAGKALLTTAICRLVEQEGLNLELCSAGELYTAQQAGFPPERMLLHGNFKLDEELEMAVDMGVSGVVVDSLSELRRLAEVAQRRQQRVDICLRVVPGIKPQTHSYVQTGQVDTKFGLHISTGAATEGVRLAQELDGLSLRGVHCHIGSQMFELDSFARAIEIMVEFMAQVRDDLGVTLEELNLGGGLGIAYTPEDAPPTIAELADTIAEALEQAIERHGFPMPTLVLEPGRSIVGTAGTTLYTAGPVKEIPGVRTYVAVDGGLSDNPRPALYEAQYTALVANRAAEPRTMPVRLVGRHCETDTLIEEVALAPVQEGDIIAVFSTGAYNYSMASNYNRFSRPAMVLVQKGQADLIVRRESLDDLLRQDVMPERLA